MPDKGPRACYNDAMSTDIAPTPDSAAELFDLVYRIEDLAAALQANEPVKRRPHPRAPQVSVVSGLPPAQHWQLLLERCGRLRESYRFPRGV